MKKVAGYWLPDADSYFGPILEKYGTFQIDHLLRAMPYVSNWSAAVDVGANIGIWSIEMACRFQWVYAFEPAPDTFACLQENVRAHYNIWAMCCALGEKRMFMSIVDDASRPGNTGARYLCDGAGVKVGVVQLDSMKFDQGLGLLKVDVEGFEWYVLKGGESIILKHRPVVIIEAKRGMAERYGLDTMDAPKLLKSWGAKLVDTVGKDLIYRFA